MKIFFPFFIVLFYKNSIEQNLTTSNVNLNKKIQQRIIINEHIVDFNKSLKGFNKLKIDYKTNNDFFILNNQTYIIHPSNNKELSKEADILAKYIKDYIGLEIIVAPNVIRKTSNKNKNTFIQIAVDKSLNKEFQIQINKRKIILKSKSNTGIYKAIIFFKNFLENEFNKNNTIYESIFFPSINIYDNDLIISSEYLSIIIVTILIISISILILKYKWTNKINKKIKTW